MTITRPRVIIVFAVLACLLAVAVVLRLLIYRDLQGQLTFTWPEGEILGLRRSSVMVAAIAGGSLAVSGVLLQAMLRNPLASPFVLGTSSGAALGVMCGIYLTYHFSELDPRAGGSIPGTGAGALLGAMGALLVVFLLGRRRGLLDPLSLVLVGLVLSAICGALIMFLQHLVPTGLKADLVTWMMGHVGQGTETWILITTGAIAVFGLGLSVAMGRAMDVATLDEDEARSVGLSVGRLRLVMFIMAGVLTAMAVALAGPIGFVGLLAPHAGRLLLGPRHGRLVIASAIIGMTLLVGADVASQAIHVQGGRMPVGIFTALLGGPAFIWLLRTGRGQV